MKRIRHRPDQRPRWILYHGTSSRRLAPILSENRLRVDRKKLSLTTEFSVAEYFACNAVFADHHDHPNQDSAPRVLVLD
jgi:RNA:NAD 2'-phosphotransferase (TPT1/KptA family)